MVLSFVLTLKNQIEVNKTMPLPCQTGALAGTSMRGTVSLDYLKVPNSAGILRDQKTLIKTTVNHAHLLLLR